NEAPTGRGSSRRFRVAAFSAGDSAWVSRSARDFCPWRDVSRGRVVEAPHARGAPGRGSRRAGTRSWRLTAQGEWKLGAAEREVAGTGAGSREVARWHRGCGPQARAHRAHADAGAELGRVGGHGTLRLDEVGVRVVQGQRGGGGSQQGSAWEAEVIPTRREGEQAGEEGQSGCQLRTRGHGCLSDGHSGDFPSQPRGRGPAPPPGPAPSAAPPPNQAGPYAGGGPRGANGPPRARRSRQARPCRSAKLTGPSVRRETASRAASRRRSSCSRRM